MERSLIRVNQRRHNHNEIAAPSWTLILIDNFDIIHFNNKR